MYDSGGGHLYPIEPRADWQGKGGERPGMQADVCHAAEDRQFKYNQVKKINNGTGF